MGRDLADSPRAKLRAARMARVLAAYEQSGKIGWSCIEADVDRGVTTYWRKAYPDFAERWRAAAARHETVRLTRLAGKRAVRPRLWTAARQQQFIDVLAATGNVRAAARAIGMKARNAYTLRLGDAAFRAAWKRAVDQVLARVELDVVDEALNGVRRRREGARKAASDRIRGIAFAASQRRGEVQHGNAEDEAARDRDEALANKWIADLCAAIGRFA